jgi:hypothetical protein
MSERQAQPEQPRFVGRGKLILAILLLSVATPIAYQAFEVLSTPDIGEPFDIEAFTSYTLPKERNAFVHYRKAIDVLVPAEKVEEDFHIEHPWNFFESVDAAEEGWEHAAPEVRHWVAVNRPALDEMRRAAERTDCLQFPLREVLRGYGFSRVSWTDPLEECAQLEALEAARLSAEGHPAEAWTCCRTLLRTGRLLSMHTDQMGSMVASTIGQMGALHGIRWSSQGGVSTEELRQAIQDMGSIEEMKTPNSDTIKIEYIMIRESTMSPDWTRYTGYPTQLLRSARLVVANLLSQADLPRYLRTPIHPGPLGLFELDPTSPPDPRLLPAEKVERSTVTTAGIVAKALEPVSRIESYGIALNDPAVALTGLQAAYQTQDIFEAKRAGLLLALALQLHHREHGSFPARLEELVTNGYLKSIPVDRFGRGEAFRYRREPGAHGAAVVWSVWLDGIDQGGIDLQPEGPDWVFGPCIDLHAVGPDWVIRVPAPPAKVLGKLRGARAGYPKIGDVLP